MRYHPSDDEDSLSNAIHGLSLGNNAADSDSEGGDTVQNGDSCSVTTLDDASQHVSDFFTSDGIFSLSSTFSIRDRKLALWQSLLIGFQICAPAGVTILNNKKDKRLPLPTTLTQCNALLKSKLYVNLQDMANYGTKAKRFRSYQALMQSTHARQAYYPLKKAKRELLQPLLREFRIRL